MNNYDRTMKLAREEVRSRGPEIASLIATSAIARLAEKHGSQELLELAAIVAASVDAVLIRGGVNVDNEALSTYSVWAHQDIDLAASTKDAK